MNRLLPPRKRGAQGLRLTAAAAYGKLELPICNDCGWLQYPPQEICAHCLSSALKWSGVQPTASLLASTQLHHSNEPYFSARLPLRIGVVALDEGGQAFVYLLGDSEPGDLLSLQPMLNRVGEGVLVAWAEGADRREIKAAMNEVTYSPLNRRFAVYTADPKLARSISTALLEAGAKNVRCLSDDTDFVFYDDELVDRVSINDLLNSRSVEETIGLLDGLIVTGLGAGGAHSLDALSQDKGRQALSIAVHKPWKLIQALCESLAQRGGVILHIGSVFARSHLPAMGLESAVQATALSMIEGARAHCHTQGVRVLSLHVGPYGGPSTLSLPGVSCVRIAQGAVRALQAGREESAADAAAEDLIARQLESPKVVERELASQMNT